MINQNKITGIILAAGLSQRMNSFKPLLTTESGETFIQSIVNKLKLVCDEIVVVTGHRSNEIVAAIDSNEVEIVFNQNYRSGMFSSLQTGLSKRTSDWYLYHFVDQPSLSVDFYSHFIKQIETKINWIQPIFENKKGHPILFDNRVKENIISNPSTQSLRMISQDKSFKKKFWKFESELIFQDIDTKKEYSELAI